MVAGRLVGPTVDDGSAVGRMTLLLEAFDDDLELTLAELSRRSGLPKSTVHRTVELMVAHGWLQRDGGEYRYGTRMFELGGRVRAIATLRRVAVPFMEDLYESTRLVVNLGVLDGVSVLYIEKIWGHRHLATPSQPGGRFAASSTALGKAMLAFSPPNVVERVLASGLEPRTSRTIVDPNVFREELCRIAARGYAVDDEEFAEGMRCCAAPVLVGGGASRSGARAVGAVSVTGSTPDVNTIVLVPQILRATAGIAAQFVGAAP